MIAAGQYVAGGIKATDGTLWMYGANDVGELGQGYTGSSIETLTQVGTYTWKNLSCGYNSTYAIRSDDTGWVWGSNNGGLLGLGDENDRWSPVQIGTQLWSQIAGGVDSTVAIFT
jgi:alpha-tubulin suppressor-like RCC1 family protein